MPSPGTRFAIVCLAFAGATTAPAARLQDNFFGVTALDAQRAWMVGNFGSIFATADGGRSWRRQNAGTRMPLFGVDFADATHGWVVGQGGLILRTTDGGASWTRQTSPVAGGKHFFEIEAIDRQTAWTVGDWGAIATTTDGGGTWTDLSLGTLVVEHEETPDRSLRVITDDVILYDVEFVDAEHGAIAGEFGTVLVTTDGGAVWRRTETGTDKTLFGITFTTPRTGWAVGIDGIILRTVDGGATWEVQHGVIERSDIGELNFMEAMKNPGLYEVAVQGEHGVIVGDTGALWVSTDGGGTWARRALPGKDRLVWMRDVSLASGGGGVVVGAAGFSAPIADGEVLGRENAPATSSVD